MGAALSRKGPPAILVVCTANICRSPVGEALLARKLEQSGYPEWRVESAGTWALEGMPAAENSVRVAAKRGLSLSRHKSRAIENLDLEEFDLVLCMESGHVEALRLEFPHHRDRILLLSELAGEERSVADPIGGTLTEYETMAADVDRLLDEGLARLVELVGLRQDAGNQ